MHSITALIEEADIQSLCSKRKCSLWSASAKEDSKGMMETKERGEKTR